MSSSITDYVRQVCTTYRNNLENDVLAICGGKIDTTRAGLIQSAAANLQTAMSIETRLRRSGDSISVELEIRLRKERDAALARRDACAREACKPLPKAHDGTDLIPRSEIVAEIRTLLAEAQRSPLPRPPLSPELQRLQEQQHTQIDMLSDLHKKRQSCGVFSDDQPANYGPNDSDSDSQSEGT